MPAEPAGLMPGTLDLLILKAVSLGELHGYGVLLRIQQMTRGGLAVEQGALYPALYRMEARGWLSSEWSATDTGRRARFYRLTRKGRAQLAAEEASWARLTLAVQSVMRS